MRKLVAILSILLLVVHTALAGVAAAPCCIEECPANAACADGMCSGCAPAGVVPADQATKLTAPEQADTVRQDHLAPEPASRVWTPPD
jgi:hypothetical protein